jgi:hypothetical protein
LSFFLLVDANHARAQETQSDTLDVRVESAGLTKIGRLRILSNDKIVVDDKFGKRTEFARADVFAISFVKPLFDRPDSKPWLFLVSGDVLKLTPTSIDDSSVAAKSSSFGRLPPFKIPLEFCQAVTWSQSTDPIRQATELHYLLKRQKDSDLLQLRNGDRIEGEFLSLANGQIAIETAVGETKLDVQRIRYLVFNPDLISKPKPSTSFISMTTSDGSSWKLSNITLEKESLKAESVSGFKFALPITTLVELRFFGDHAIPLSSLTPEKQTIEKYLALSRPPTMNFNVLGGRLMVGRHPFASGIGCMSGTTIEWSVPKNGQSFHTSVGLDRASKGKGSVRFEVLVDGESKWKSERLTGKSSLVEVPPIDLAGAKTLVLKTHIDDFGQVLDYANWCNATILTTE